MKDVIFTICAKNYLAQALALKTSLKQTNPDRDFYIFIADSQGGIEDIEVVFPHESWIPEWRNMAFKYNVIEYSTSIKPFCIKYLFQNYQKIVFIDPDTYATDSFDQIFDALDTKDIMITPHYSEMQEDYTGAVPEEEILFVGIYNLGFLAIKNSDIGKKIVAWWMNRLEDKCYADKYDALHVDQKWFDFIPAFFPDNVLISHHFGINTAIWNLHERELIAREDKYFVINKVTRNEFPLLFFHFSGFNPKNPTIINRRHPDYNVESFPTFKLLFKAYTDSVLDNDFERFTHIPYGFNTFLDGEKITPLHRRLFREIGQSIKCKNPFDTKDAMYLILKENKFLTGIKIIDSTFSNPNIIRTRDREIKMGISFLKFIKRILGIKYYYYMLVFFGEYHRLERQTLLLKEESVNKYR
ncbi:hypothetical protein SNE25_09735 [Mucilaginibacter sabulilitoris]|uniref:Glycosyl transferase n=1 Tax=Mucilaginibacter sabulilitoris TaxID=1173583 RepID=A0ABZ0TTJ1_9SPHI|nr:hypothetical protein [Mucilaginibacter sabulilitoris]WPU95797.1 hypothetical protein SNE25_09735 [Mucilaginibacter sabulilitoris]